MIFPVRQTRRVLARLAGQLLADLERKVGTLALAIAELELCRSEYFGKNEFYPANSWQLR
jgi:hypothetical protein